MSWRVVDTICVLLLLFASTLVTLWLVFDVVGPAIGTW